MAAALAMVELCGPSQFAGWDQNGEPVGKPHPNAYVTVSATAESQTRTTADVLQWMVSDRMRADYQLNVGVERVSANGGRGQLVFSASSFRAIEGKRPTFSILNEIQHWVSGNQGHQMYNTLNGNLTKSPNGVARMLAITNAYQPGEDSVGEVLRQAYFDQVEYDRKNPGKRRAASIYYDSLEVDPKAPADPDTIMQVIPHVRGDSVWLDPEAIVGSFMDRSIPLSHNRRMFYNQVVAKEDALFSEGEWDSGKSPGELQPGDEIVLGFDGGKTDDATALIAKRVSDGFVVPIMIWEKPPTYVETDWEIDRREVDSYVHWCFKTFKVSAFYADVALWESYIDQWADAYRDRLAIKANGTKHAVGWDMRGGLEKITRMNESIMTRVLESAEQRAQGVDPEDLPFRHNGNRVLRKHALNARRRENRYGLSFGKESRESPLKVDAYAALLLAEMAYRDLKESGKRKEKRKPGSIIAY